METPPTQIPEWEIGIMDLEEGNYDAGRVYHIHLRCRRTDKALRGIVVWHEECVFAEEVEKDDFFLTRPVAMRLLIKLAKDMAPRLGHYGESGFGEFIRLEEWLRDRCENDDGEWLYRLVNRAVRTFS